MQKGDRTLGMPLSILVPGTGTHTGTISKRPLLGAFLSLGDWLQFPESTRYTVRSDSLSMKSYGKRQAGS